MGPVWPELGYETKGHPCGCRRVQGEREPWGGDSESLTLGGDWARP